MTAPNTPVTSSGTTGKTWGGGFIAFVVIVAVIKYTSEPSKPTVSLPQNPQRVPISALAKAPPQTTADLSKQPVQTSPTGNSPWDAVIGDGKAPGENRPAKYDPWDAVIGTAPSAKRPASNDPWEAVVSGAGKPVAPQQSPLERLGWNRGECMMCKGQRTKQDQTRFSDGNGFGFCDKCGTCADAFAVHRANFERGIGSPPQVEQLAKTYLKAIETVTRGNPFLALPYTTAFSQWGNNKAWQEAWQNIAVLIAVPKR